MRSFLIKSQELIENSYDDDVELKNTINLTESEKRKILLSDNNNIIISSIDSNNILMNLSTMSYANYDCQIQDQNEIGATNFILGLTNRLLIIFPWIILIIGTISNIISFIVLTRPKLRKSSTFFYLSCLCVIDLSFLYTVCGNMIFFYQFNIDLQLKSVIICKLYSFLIYFLPQFSAWTCAAVSLDRVVSVIFSVRGKHAAAAKRFNTPNKALQVMLIIFTCLFLLNLQFFFYPNEFVFQNDEVQDINIIYCSPENIPRYETFYTFWVYIDLSVNVLIPFAIMIACSLIIIIGVIKSTKNMTSRAKPHDKNRKLSVSNKNTTTTFSSKSDHQQQPLIANKLNSSNLNRIMSTKHHPSGPNSKAKNVSTMLATNNLVFISLTLPIVVFLSITPSFREPTLCNHKKAKLRLIKIICIILMNTNYCINLFIYIFMASQFRIQLLNLIDQILFCIKFKNNKSTTDSLVTSKTISVKPTAAIGSNNQQLKQLLPNSKYENNKSNLLNKSNLSISKNNFDENNSFR